jgi:hypothetical protein
LKSALSGGNLSLTQAPNFDQAARIVACMAQVLSNPKTPVRPENLSSLGFCVLAPQLYIDAERFSSALSLDSIRKKVWERVSQYKYPDREKEEWLEKEEWFRTWFVPTLEGVKIDCISWEQIMVPSRVVLELADASAGDIRLSDHAARSMIWSVGFSARVCQPSTFRIVICPEASSAQNSMAAVSAQGRMVWVLMRRLNSSCRRSIAFEVRIDLHWLGGKRVKVNSLSPASSRLRFFGFETREQVENVLG